MKTHPFFRTGLLVLAIGTIGAFPSLAQQPPNPPPAAQGPAPAGPGSPHDLSFLSQENRDKLKAAHDTAFAANPDLKTEHDALKADHQALKAKGADATPADRQAFMQKAQGFEEKVRAAELAIDPSLAPIFAQIDQKKQEWKAQHEGQPKS